ncbi:Predicted RNA-binding protein, contains PUA-like domain [Algoriphagus locisalis]|uniref:Predicted RNA-binding protein, contains PUA-like domain n=1 Tax=Algoriphagus locisalis TaxID=305507 RepID=A0A1I7C8Z9_9BACT|nr:EVE domain-containing protein [Algoriphagus locisalis]SFT95899.1 Predicted RNA-binding protein, contains PUA-like domain [Algoriphagus locisalis]
MKYWMVKSEPNAYSWEDFVGKNEDIWDGVRNYQARNYLREMQLGDQVFFYHSGKEKAIVGIAEVSEEQFPDPKDKAWTAVKLKVKSSLTNAISLAEIKAEDRLSDLPMLKRSRLSVLPVAKDEFELLLKMGS